ncbi:MAG TPA: catalase family protein, partial [Beijerinckia sp.]|nr:catalase family protein [Beijerinckia sp.]
GHAYRDAHRKAHGCVQASFTVLGGLPPELAQGVFAEPKDYSAIIRYSNGSGASQDDRTGDGRGMAVKVLGVDGPKILTEDPENSTQDFLMINYPVFFVRNALDYVGFERAQLRGNLGLLWWLGTHILHEGWIATRISLIHFTNPLNSRYWSMTPSKLALKQMKFSAEPCAGSRFEPGVSNSKDLLRENLEAHLAKQSACFDFKVQVRTDPRNMPIEDATIEWSEKAAPFVPVARIVIPVQKPVQGEACEVLSYTPWHTSPELRPLGGIQRVRKAVYQEISNLRHELNGQANPLVSCGASCNGSPGDSSLPTP